jgi:type IV pilus assembly protein PilC
MLNAGMPLLSALRTLAELGKDPGTKRTIDAVADHVESGGTFSDGLSTQKHSFDSIYVNMVRAGEASGNLAEVLGRLATTMEKRRRPRSKIKAALVDPVAVLTIALVITTGLMIFIVPKFAKIFQEMLGHRGLPPLTQFVLDVSNVMLNQAHLIVGSAVALILLWRFARSTPYGSRLIDTVAIRMPPTGELVTLAASAQFCQTLGTLMSAGVSVLNALRISANTSTNAVVAQAVHTVHDAVREGEGISKPLAATEVFPPIMVNMIKVGEDSGALPEMLDRVAETYEEEVDLAVESLTTLIEPAMMIGLAIVIGTIVIALFMPLIVIINELGGV